MNSELRPAEEVATEVATALTKKPANDRTLGEYLAAAVIEADRAPLLAEIERLRGALQEIMDLPGEINPSNYDHDDICELNRQFCLTYEIARAALGDSHGET